VLITLAVAALAIALLVVAFWKPLGWDVAAWWRGEAEVLTLPNTVPWGGGLVAISAGEIEVVEVARFLSLISRVNVIVPSEHSRSAKSMILVKSDISDVTPDDIIAFLRENGWRLRRKAFEGAEIYTLEPVK